MNCTLNDQIKDLHAAYLRESGMEMVLTRTCQSVWERWIHEGHTRVDLEITIRYIHKVNRTREDRYRASLNFFRIIEDTDNFARYLSDAKADLRKPPPPTPKERMLQHTGRQSHETAPAKPIRDVMKESAALADLRQWKLKKFGTEL